MERESSQSQVVGKRKYREMIHRESKQAEQKNLPFTFSKPKKDKPLNTYFKCMGCGRESSISEETYMVICASCKHLNKVKDFKKKG